MGCDIHPALEAKLYDKWCLVTLPSGLPTDRNYAAFAILANVRNGFGFAGVPTHEKLTPIADPRGFPSDMSVELMRLLLGNEYLLGDHSFSHVTLAEMEAYALDLDRKFLQVGMVNAQNAARIDAGGEPEDWCGGTNDPTYVSREWYSTLRSEVPLFNSMIEKAAAVYDLHSYDWNKKQFTKDHVRYVFGFDS